MQCLQCVKRTIKQSRPTKSVQTFRNIIMHVGTFPVADVMFCDAFLRQANPRSPHRAFVSHVCQNGSDKKVLSLCTQKPTSAELGKAIHYETRSRTNPPRRGSSRFRRRFPRRRQCFGARRRQLRQSIGSLSARPSGVL